MNLNELKKKSVSELIYLSQQYEIEDASYLHKQELIFSILKYYNKKGLDIFSCGVLEILQDGFGFLRSSYSSFLAGPNDIYVSPNQIRKFNLQTGDDIYGKIRLPKEGERYFALLKICKINNEDSDLSKNKIIFENRTPLFANEWYKMEKGNGSQEDITARIIDLISPIGKGQRGLIVSPPKAGKTVMLQNIAQSFQPFWKS